MTSPEEAANLALLDAQPLGTIFISQYDVAFKVNTSSDYGWWMYPHISRSTPGSRMDTGTMAFVMCNVKWSLS